MAVCNDQSRGVPDRGVCFDVVDVASLHHESRGLRSGKHAGLDAGARYARKDFCKMIWETFGGRK